MINPESQQARPLVLPQCEPRSQTVGGEQIQKWQVIDMTPAILKRQASQVAAGWTGQAAGLS
jgi:hypothetical protein